VFLLNAVLFVLIGLQLPHVLDEVSGIDVGTLAGYALAIIGVVVGTRFLWLFTTPYVIRALDRRPSQVERRVGAGPRIVVGWAGMRGAVSLAAALALPAGFPERDLLIFLTLAVIFATLVVQGLTLPALIRRLGVRDDGLAEREELHARKEAARAALAYLHGIGDEEWAREDTLQRMIRLYEFRHRRLRQRAGVMDDGDEEDLDARSRDYQRLVREVLDAQRRRIIELRDEGAISDEVLFVLERELDLEDQRLEI
jgi:monovalent cation/hydrogen antiporter